MVKYADTGTRLPQVEIFLDEQHTAFVQGSYPSGKELREIVNQLGGEWDCLYTPRGQYDTLNISYKGGTLIIERPWIDVPDRSQRGHRVSFDGKVTRDLEASIKSYLLKLHQRERDKYIWLLQSRKLERR